MLNKIKKAKNIIDYEAVNAYIRTNDMVRTAAKSSKAALMVVLLTTKVMADPSDQNVSGATGAITGIVNVLALITNVIGIIFVVVGFVRIVIAHSQEDAPGQQKAAMFIGTGVALILFRTFLTTLNPQGWIDTSAVVQQGE